MTTKPKKVKKTFINITPSWVGLYPLLCEWIDYGNKEQKDHVKMELKKLCETADQYNILIKREITNKV